MKTLHFSLKWKLITGFCLLGFGSLAQAPEWEWANYAPTINGYVYFDAVTTDIEGNIYFAGVFNGQYIVFENDTLYNSGFENFFLTKYSAAGDYIWAKSASMLSTNFIAIVTDSHCNVYVAGSYNSNATFDSIALPNIEGNNFFVAKYDADGNVIWAKTTPSDSQSAIKSITIDSHDNLYIAGSYSFHSIILGNTTLYTDAEGNANMFIAKMDTSGNFIWAKSAIGSHSEFGIHISANESDHIFVIGKTLSSELYFETDTLFILDNIDFYDYFFIARYDTAGNLLWVKNQGNSLLVLGSASDHLGNYYLTGSFMPFCGPVYFGNDTLINTDITTIDAFIAKYDSSGNELWARSFGGTGSDSFYKIATDASNNICVFGFIESINTQYNKNILQDSSVVILKFTPSGNLLWAKNAPSNLYPACIASWSDSVLYLGGSYNYDVTLGNQTLPGNSSTTVFLAKLQGGAKLNVHKPDAYYPVIMFPNPTSGKLTISQLPESGLIQVIDVTGQNILKTDFRNQPNINIVLPDNGVFIIRIITGKEVITKKVVVSK